MIAILLFAYLNDFYGNELVVDELAVSYALVNCRSQAQLVEVECFVLFVDGSVVQVRRIALHNTEQIA